MAHSWPKRRSDGPQAGWDPSPPPTRDPRELIWHARERGLITDERAEELLSEL